MKIIVKAFLREPSWSPFLFQFLIFLSGLQTFLIICHFKYHYTTQQL